MSKVRKGIRSHPVFDHYAFSRFIKKHPEYSERIPNIIEFKRLIMLVHDRAIQEMQDNPYGITFPGTNCLLFLNNKGVMFKKAIDFNKSKLLGKKIYHNNIATNQNVMKITYLNRIFPSTVENSELYSFYAKTPFRQTCSKFFRENYNKCLTYGKKNGLFKN